MPQNIFHDYRTFMNQDYDMVSLGIKPSGTPHIGSIATLVGALGYVDNHPGSKISLQIMDLDFDQQRGNAFVPFLYRSNGMGSTFRELFRSDLEDVITVLDDIYHGKVKDKIKVEFFSEFLFASEISTLFLDVLKDESLMQSLNYELFDQKMPNTVPVSGICPNCQTSTSQFAKRTYDPKILKKQENLISLLKTNSFKMTEEKLTEAIGRAQAKIDGQYRIIDSINERHGGNPEYFLTSHCQNDDCPIDSYEFDLRKSFYNIHYLVDPLRDESFSANGMKTAHVFGGDYAQPHGKNKIPKAERIRNGLLALGHMNQDFFIGPMIKYRDEKMGKSGQSVTFDVLSYAKQKFVVDYIQNMLYKGSREINYEDMMKKS